jgi:hypothetical protein
MLPHLELIVWLLVIAVMVYAWVTWLGVVFQNILFQKYRLNKNESSLRATRLREQQEERDRFRNGLLGEVKGEDE